MLNNINNIFIIGIKGVGMANLALILKKMGKNVSGSDVEEEFITDNWLNKNNIPVTTGFNPHNLPKQTDLVIYSAAHGGGENVQILEAKKRGIKVLHQAAFIAELMKQFKTTIAVAGSHGKTTTTALLAYSLIRLGAKPTYFVGSSDFNGYPGGDLGEREYFVFEADEYAVDPPQDKTVKFQFWQPEIILSPNVDFDHPDVYKDLEQVKEEFRNFFKKAKKVYICKDDPISTEIIQRAEIKDYKTFGYSAKSDIVIKNVKFDEKGSEFELFSTSTNNNYGLFNLSLYGKKSVSNAAGIILILIDLGFDLEKIKKAIKGFSGPKRRFEKIAYENDTYLFDDYAHHPIEIEATIKATRERFKNRRIIVLFQSHTYSRTAALLDEFVAKLSLADLSLIGPIFPSARENPKQFNVSSLDFEKKAKEKNISNVKGFSTMRDLLIELGKKLKKGDVVFTMGAGNVYKLEADIIDIIKNNLN